MIIIGKEDYEELKEYLSETFKEIEEIKSEGIVIDGEHFDVEWWVPRQISLAKSIPFSGTVKPGHSTDTPLDTAPRYNGQFRLSR